MKYILIDLDGTITDPMVGITKSVQYALKDFHIYIEDLNSLCKYIGPPLRTSFMEYNHLNEEEAERAVAKYREYYTDKGIFENEVYEGISELFERLREAGKILIVATSKPEQFAKIIMEHFNLSKYFDDICGATMDNTRDSKEKVIRYALEKNQITDYSEAVMVGDRLHDVEGAKAVGLPCIGVLYGYGSRQEHEEAGADKIAQTVDELYDIIMEL